MTDFEDKLKKLKIAYLAKLKDTFPEIAGMTLEKCGIMEIYQRIHKIAGTSGMYGLREVSEIATKFELYLKPLKDGNAFDKKELEAKLLSFVEEYKSLIGV